MKIWVLTWRKNGKTLKSALGNVNYETIAPVTVLRTVALIADRNCKKEHILDMDKARFIDHWDKTVEAVHGAVDYFHRSGIRVSKLLPYDALVASYAYFFSMQKAPPSHRQTELLEDFFWRVAFTGRYSSAVESKLAEDVKHMESFLKEEEADYGPEWGISVSPDYIIVNGFFATGRAYVKAILCLYASHKPRSFNNNHEVIIDNNWLKQINSKNYHHFFPRGFLKKQDVAQEMANHILNITIVDDFLNKNIIGARPPSDYMSEFRKVNPQLAETMQTHLISDLDGFGVFEDNYDKFLNERAKIVSQELRKRIIPHQLDGEKQPDILGDYEEPEVE